MGLFGGGFNPKTHLLDLTGRVVIVTGGNSGIGFTTVKHLARKGARVYLAARCEAKAKAAMERLATEGLGSGEVHFLHLDLSDPCLAKAAAKDFFDKEDRLDILVNNAAQTLIPFRKTLHDIQDIMVVNYFSTVAFTHALLPLLEKTAQLPGADVRIINLASSTIGIMGPGSRFRSREDFNRDFEKSFTPQLSRYGLSKVALVTWSNDLQRRLAAKNVPILVACADPGCVHTEGNTAYANTHNFLLSHFLNAFSYVLFNNADEGSYTTVYAAASHELHKEPKTYYGAYFKSVKKLNKVLNKDVNNEDVGKELWQSTQDLLGEMGAWTDCV